MNPLKIKQIFSSLLFVEFDGKAEEILRDSEIFEKFLKERGYQYVSAEDEEEIESFWEIRRAISPSLKKLGSKKNSR